jgi:hypothetical protein
MLARALNHAPFRNKMPTTINSTPSRLEKSSTADIAASALDYQPDAARISAVVERLQPSKVEADENVDFEGVINGRPWAETATGTSLPSASPITTEPETASADQPWLDAAALAALLPPVLVAAINSGHKDIQAAAHTASRHTANALTGALRTGALLAEVHRREKKTGWGAWVEKNCPELPISTAYRYMGLARKFPHVRMGQEITGLRQAYIAVGMMPDKTPAMR